VKIFFSHSSRDKAVVRDVKSRLPNHVRVWLDESELLTGMDIENSLKGAIDQEADYVVVFLSRTAIQSDWVSRELAWALSREKELGREFVLPVVLDDVWESVKPVKFRKKKYLKCFDQSDIGLDAFAKALAQDLFAWVSKRSEREQQAKETMKAFTGGLSKMESDVPAHWLQTLLTFVDGIGSLKPELQLERLTKRVERESEKWKATEERTKADMQSRSENSDSDALVRLGMTMYAVSVARMVDRLEEIKEELDFWKQHRDEVSAEDTLARVKEMMTHEAG
jgi:TIR domain